MPNPNIKPRFKKGDPATREAGRKGGHASKGKVSIKSALRRALDTGTVDVDLLAKSLLLHAQDGNAGIARLVTEYIDGKVKDQMELTGADGQPFQQKIEVEFVKSTTKTTRKAK